MFSLEKYKSISISEKYLNGKSSDSKKDFDEKSNGQDKNG